MATFPSSIPAMMLSPRSDRCGCAKDGRRLAGQYTAIGMCESNLGAFDLPVSADTAKLLHGLDDREEAVHAGMIAGEASAIGIHRQAASRRDGAARHESPAFALGTESQIFQEQEGCDREGIVDHDMIDIVRIDARHRIGAP